MHELHSLLNVKAMPLTLCPQVEAQSRAAKPLCWWALSVHELMRVGREAELKRSKIAEAEDRLEAANK
jgi:hypothetical protein